MGHEEILRGIRNNRKRGLKGKVEVSRSHGEKKKHQNALSDERRTGRQSRGGAQQRATGESCRDRGNANVCPSIVT